MLRRPSLPPLTLPVLPLLGAAVALSAIRSPVTLETQGILPIWYDAFLHGLSVQAFAGLEGPPMDPELYGASLIFYHYAPFVPPAALLDVAGINGLTAVAGHLLPLGLLIGALGLYALVVQLAGRAAGVVALALLVIVPDPADYMLLSGWFDMAWLLFGSVGSGYGMGPMFVAAACLHAALGGAEHRRRVAVERAQRHGGLDSGCASSGGASATVTITSAKIALARLTKDSIASDSRPTEPVTYQARVLRMMVTTATPAETASRRRGVRRSSILRPG